MKQEPKGLVYTILADTKSIVAIEASGREAGELCKEAWFRSELCALKSKGDPLCGVRTKLRARPAIEAELVRYQEVSDKAQASDEILFVYSVELDDVKQQQTLKPLPLARDLFGLIPVGEENAVTGHLLWKHMGMWSAASVKHKLNEMAAAGLIERKGVLRDGRPTNLYFRLPV